MKGKIYLLSNSVDDKIYVGSTTQRLCRRMASHQYNARRGLTSILYTYMRKIGVSKWVAETIKTQDVGNRQELEKLEFKYMSMYPQKLLLNMNTDYAQVSEECRKKCSISNRGDRTSKFKRGSIKHYEQKQANGTTARYIKFSWRSWTNDISKQRSKSFFVKKYGERGAMKMAKEYQNKIYPKAE